MSAFFYLPAYFIEPVHMYITYMCLFVPLSNSLCWACQFYVPVCITVCLPCWACQFYVPVCVTVCLFCWACQFYVPVCITVWCGKKQIQLSVLFTTKCFCIEIAKQLLNFAEFFDAEGRDNSSSAFRAVYQNLLEIYSRTNVGPKNS